MQQKILTIGDIHGRDKWKFHTHGSPYEFNLWKIAVENGAEPDSDFWNDLPFRKYDKIIFVGDYVDSFDLSNGIILSNLEDLIFLKKQLQDKIILLLGNHDIQYFIENQICSGYRGEMQDQLRMIYLDRSIDFKIAHLEIGNNGEQFLWSHAGITQGWYNELRANIFNEDHRLYDIFKDYKSSSIDHILNLLLEVRHPMLFHVDRESGGIEEWAGPLWVRPKTLNANSLSMLNQIVGHTPFNCLKIQNFEGYKHYFVDCLWDDYNEVLELEL